MASDRMTGLLPIVLGWSIGLQIGSQHDKRKLIGFGTYRVYPNRKDHTSSHDAYE